MVSMMLKHIYEECISQNWHGDTMKLACRAMFFALGGLLDGHPFHFSGCLPKRCGTPFQ